MRAAIAAKLRASILPAEARKRVLAASAELMKATLQSLPPDNGIFDTAAAFAGNVDAKLRAGDAFHLAFADRHGATLCTLDRRQAEAGGVVSVPTLLL